MCHRTEQARHTNTFPHINDVSIYDLARNAENDKEKERSADHREGKKEQLFNQAGRM